MHTIRDLLSVALRRISSVASVGPYRESSSRRERPRLPTDPLARGCVLAGFAVAITVGASAGAIASTGSHPAATAGNSAAGWLIAQQFANGGFPWGKGDASAAPNTQGATALSLLRMYAKNGDPTLLAAARKNGDCQLAGETCIAGSTYGGAGGGHHRFSGHDPLFLHRLSAATGSNTYDSFADSEFWGRLAAGTYGANANFNLAGYIANDFSARSGTPELVAWDLAKLAIAAKEAGTGRTNEMNQLMDAIKTSLEQGGPGSGHTSYDEVALAGAIWASAVTEVDLDPAAGGWASANSTADLAAMLASLQITTGTSAGAFSDTSTGAAGGNSDGPNVQATAYALLALSAVDAAAYATNITNGYAYIRAQQQPDGQILYQVGATDTTAGGVESHAEALESYALNQFQPDRYVGSSGTDAGDCSNAAARCKTIAYALGQAARYDTIHVAAGNYIVTAPLNVALEGVQIVGDDAANKPVVTRIATYGTDANQPLMTIANVKNVRVANMDFRVDLSYAAEGIQASGIVDGLIVEANHFGANQSTAVASTFGRRNAVSINLVNRQDGSFARVRDNVIDGQIVDILHTTLFRAGVAMDAGLGEITGNTIAALSHDVIVRFSTKTAASSGANTLIQGNHLQFGGISFSGPNANSGTVTINDNDISAPSFADQFIDEADFALGRIIANDAGVLVTISNNRFSGHAKFFRGLLIENFPGVTLTDNTFTPKPGATDFTSLVLSNKELATTPNPPAAPRPIGLIAQGNTFNGNGSSVAGTAVMFINDNDANGGMANYGSLLFGGAGADEPNQFDGNLRWYYYLRDETCSTTTATVGATVGGPAPQCTFLGYNAVGALPNTFVRPFKGNVEATQNLYAGNNPSLTNINALRARTYDSSTNNVLGTVNYGENQTQSAVYVDDDFAGHFWGDALPFSHGAIPSRTVYYGIDAFATIGEGLTHVVNDGKVYVATGSYTDATTIGHSAQIIGDGTADTNPVNSTVVSAGITIAASGTSSSNLLLKDLRVSGVNGVGISLTGSQSYITLDGVVSSGNIGDGLHIFGTGTTQFLTVTNSHFDGNGHFPPTFNGDLVAGFNVGENASASDVTISGSSFNGNNGAGLVVNNIGSASSVSTIHGWTITGSDFSHNIPLDPAPADDPNGFYTAGGGLWLKTGAAGSVIDGFTVTGSTFADNGTGQINHFATLPDRKINANGISVRARPNTTIQNVHICNNTFSETAASATQLVGIYVFDDTQATNHGYSPIEVCGDNHFNGLDHSVSGYEQFGNRGSAPVVNITGGTISNTEYINGFVTRIHAGTQYGSFTTITAAMTDANTVDGDEIHAPAGYYNEQVTITHNDMTLSGDGAATIIDGTGKAGSGVILPNGRTGVTLDGFTVRNFTALGGADACVAGFGGNNGTTIQNLVVDTCSGGGKGGIYLAGGGGLDGVTIDSNDVKNIGPGALRGIVIWDGFKTHITITNNHVHDMTGCCGIELQDGSASGVTVTGNTVERVGDSGMAFLQLTSGAGPNLIANNTITDTGRFGIEIKLPNGSGADNGDGSIVVQGNIIDGAGAKNLRDRAGISVQRRAYCATCSETDITRGVVVRGNTVHGFRSSMAGFEGYGIAVEGLASDVSGNALDDNDVGLQVQQGNPNGLPPGDANQDAHSDWFGRGNAPLTCIDVGSNTLTTNTLDRRDMPAGAKMVGQDVTNLDTNAKYCSITAAVAAATAGQHIGIAAGTHAENAIVTKSVTITGAGQAQTTVVPALYNPDCSAGGGTSSLCDGGSVPASTVFLVRASDVTISDLSVDGVNANLPGHASDIAARNGIMTDYIVDGPYTGFNVHDTTVQNIWLRGIYAPSIGGSIDFRNNTVRHVKSDPDGASIAIFSRYSSGIVDHNTVDDAGDAISSNWSKGITFSNNTVTNSGSGIHTDNSGGAGGSGDLIEGNTVSCGVADAYGIWAFATYADVTAQDNHVIACAVGLGAFASRTDDNTPIFTTRFLRNTVDGAGSSMSTPGDQSIGAWLGTTTFYYGEHDNAVEMLNNTISGYDIGVLTQRAGGKRLTSNAHMNRLSGNTVGWSDNGDAANVSNGTSDFTNNWWGCNDDPRANALSHCAPANGSGTYSPWLVLSLPASPINISRGASIPIAADLLHNSAGNSVASVFPDVTTSIAFAADHGANATSPQPLSSGAATTTFSGLTAGYSDVTATLENAVATVRVQITPAGITLDAGTLDATYDTHPHAVTATTSPAGLTYAVAYNGSSTAPTNAGTYNVVATITDANGEGSTSGTLTIHKAAGTVTFDALTYTGSAQAVTAHITQESGSSCTATPATVGPDAGSYPVSATCTGTNYDASGNGVVVIGKASSTITISGNLHPSYDGSTHAVSASASPISSGRVDVTYDGSATPPSAVGTYSVLATLVDPNYTATPVSAVLTISDAAAITITADAAQAMALVGDDAPYTDFVDYTGTLQNTGEPTGQKVHTVISVVRIDDGNTIGENPIAIDAVDVEACLYDPSGWAAQDPDNHNGCPEDYESLVFSQGSGAYNGRPAVTFRYPVNPAYDQPLPTIDPAVATPPAKFRFKRGDYQVHVSLVGADGTVYASAFDGTTVPEASVTYAGATSGQAEDALLSQTRLRNTGGRVDGNVIVRVTLSDADSGPGNVIPLDAGDAEFAYQLGDTYATLPWVGNAADGGLVTYFGPPVIGFPLEDGHDATTAGRGIFHREGSYRLTYEVLDMATQTTVFATSTTTPLTIGPNMVNFALSDLSQVYDGTPRAVTVTPANVPHTTVYEQLISASCPASPSGSNTTPPTDAGSYCVYVNATGTYQGSASGMLVVARQNVVVTLDDNDGSVDGTIHRTYDGHQQAVSAGVQNLPAVLARVTYNGDVLPPTVAGTYSVVATVDELNYTGSTSGTLIIAADGGATIVLDGGTLNATWNGSPHAVTATTTPGGIAYAVTYVGDGATVYPQSATAPTSAGQYHVVATTTDVNYTPVSASGTLVITSATASIALDASTLTATWDGNPHAVTATTTPNGLAYTITYDGLLDPPSAVGSYAIVATLDDANHNAPPATGTLVISAAGATITLDSGTLAATYDGQTHAVTATTNPTGLAYAVTYNGSATPPVNAGSYAVVATVTAPGHSGSANGTLVIAKASGVVSFSATNATFDGTPHAIGAVISQEPGNGAACTLTPTGEYPRTNAGSTTLAASCTGTNYTANGGTTLVVSSKPVTIALSGLGSFPYTGSAHAATATVGGTIAGFPANAVVAYTPGGASAPTAVGGYDVAATLDAASTNYTASAANGTIVIGAANASVTLGNLAQTWDGTPRVATASTTPSGLAVSLTYDGSATAPTNAGAYNVVATITAPGYSGSASGTLVVAKKAETVTLANLSATWDGNPHAASATTAPDTVAVAITYDGSATAPTNAGSYAVVATVSDANHVGSANGTLTIAKASATVTIAAADLHQVYGATHAVGVTTDPTDLSTSVTYDGGAGVPTELGSYSVVATIADANHVGLASATLVVANGAAQTIAANGGTTFTGIAGQPLAGALPSVKVTDAGGHPVAGVAITFAAATGNGTLSGASQSTDQNGVATLGGWTLDATPGTNTVTASADGVTGTVTFTADGAAASGALSVTISDTRTATQVGSLLTYTITVGNSGTSNAATVSVTAPLPAELDGATARWQCTAINGATCATNGSGGLSDNINLPAGSSVVYLLTARVVVDVDGVIDNTVVAEDPSTIVEATDHTEIVIFRDGFELGGDGSEPWPAGTAVVALGTLDAMQSPNFAVDAAQLGSLQRATLAQAGDGAFRVEAIRIDATVYVRLVARTAQGEAATDWSALDGDHVALVLDGAHLGLVGAKADLGLTLAHGGTFTVAGVSRH